MAGTTESSQSGCSEACPLTAISQVACSQQTGPRGCAQSPSLFRDPALGAEGRATLPETAETRGFFGSLLVETFSCGPLLGTAAPEKAAHRPIPLTPAPEASEGSDFRISVQAGESWGIQGACGLRACSFHTWAPGTILKYKFCGRANSSGLGLCASLTPPPTSPLSLFSLLPAPLPLGSKVPPPCLVGVWSPSMQRNRLVFPPEMLKRWLSSASEYSQPSRCRGSRVLGSGVDTVGLNFSNDSETPSPKPSCSGGPAGKWQNTAAPTHDGNLTPILLDHPALRSFGYQ